MELEIYNQSDVCKMTVSTSPSSVLNQELMVEDALSVSWCMAEYSPLEVNDYVLIENTKYKIKKEYKPKKKSNQEYVYSLKFYGPIHDAQQALYLNLTDGQYNPQFSLDGTPREHLQKWVDNMNRVAGSDIWSIGTVIVSTNKTIDYNNLYCWDAGNQIAESFETEIWADGFVVNLCRCERGESVELGYLNGLTSLVQNDNEDVKFFTRLIPLGSTRNIDSSTYGFSRLQLPDRKKYVDRNTHYGLFEQVEESAFTGIFPKYIGTITAVRSEEKKGEDGKPFTIYYFKDSGMTFDPNKSEIAELVKHVSFQNGDLNGRDFEANYNTDNKEWEILNIYPDENIQIPGGNLIPAVGDLYIPWNFRMPESYEKQAEIDYQEAVLNLLNKYSDDVSIYEGNTDYIHIEKESIPLKLGQRVRLLSSEYFGEQGYRDSRMTRVTCKLDNLSMATISCTNQVGKGWKSSVESSLKKMDYVLAQQQEQTEIDIIKTFDVKDATNKNVFSALKSLASFIRKDIADIAQGIITFLKGIKIGKFVSGMIGGSGAAITVDEYGKTTYEGDKMVLREELIVPKITFNCIDVISGDKANTFAFGTIKSVDKKNFTAELDLLEGQTGTAKAGDIIRGVFHNIEGSNNTEDGYDENGFLNYAGFSTAYFTPTEILVNEPGNFKFRFALKAGTTVYPMKGMNFYAYGNFTDKSRQAITYENRYYTRRLKNVNTWVIDPDKHIAMQDGLLEGLTIGGMDMHGYGTYEENMYMIGPIIQFTPEQKEDLKGEDAYSVNLSTYESIAVVDEDNNIIGGLIEEKFVSSGDGLVTSEEKYVVAQDARFKTRIQAFKGKHELLYSPQYAEDSYLVIIEPTGCKAEVDSGIVFITEITDIDKCFVDIQVNCEGNVVLEKTYKIRAVRNGASTLSADLDNESDSIACDLEGNVLFGLPIVSTASMSYGTHPVEIDKLELDIPAGVTASSEKGTITITGITKESDPKMNIGVTVYGTYGKTQYHKKISMLINKIFPGENGENAVIYNIQPSIGGIKMDTSGNNDVTTISACVIKTDGLSSGIIAELPEGYSMNYLIDDDTTIHNYTPANDIDASVIKKKIVFRLYSGTTMIDQETIYVNKDGQDGTNAIECNLDNSNTAVACDENGVVLFGLPLETHVTMILGTIQLELTEVIAAYPEGVTGTADKSGLLRITGISQYVGKTIQINVTVKATYKGFTYARTVVWTVVKSLKGIDGEDPVIYDLLPSTNSVSINKNGVRNPSSISCNLKKITAQSYSVLNSIPTGYYMSVQYDDTGTMFDYSYGSVINLNRIAEKSVTFFLMKIAYDDIIIDKERIPLVRDGNDGDIGPTGKDGTFLKQIFIQRDTKPATPSGNTIPTGWSESSEFGELTILGYDGVFFQDRGSRRSPKNPLNSQSYTDKIKFRTTKVNQLVTLQVTVSSEANYDLAFIGKLDTAVSSNNYTQVISGAQTIECSINVPTPGDHYIGIMYSKDGSGSSGQDMVKYCPINGKTIWVSSAQATYDKYSGTWVYGTWSQPVRHLADSTDVEYVFRRKETLFIPASDPYMDNYIPAPFSTDEDYRGDFITSLAQDAGAIYKSGNSYYQCIKNRISSSQIQITDKEYFTYLEPFTDDPLGVTEEYPIEYMSVRYKRDGKWGPFSLPSPHARYSEGKPGEEGVSGAIYRRWKGFTIGKEYRNDEGVSDLSFLEADGVRYIDVILIENKLTATGYDCYIARKFNGQNVWMGTTENDPRNETFVGNLSPHWQMANSMAPVFLDFLIAKNAVIDFLQGNKIQIMNDDNSVACVIGNGEYPIMVGSGDPTKAVTKIDKYGKIYSSSVDLSGIINASGGSIGDFIIDSGNLSNKSNKDCWVSIDYDDGKGHRRVSSLGNNLPAILGTNGVCGYFDSSGKDDNIAIKLNASGSKSSSKYGGKENYAIVANGGCSWGLQPDDVWRFPGVLFCTEVYTTKDGVGFNNKWGNGFTTELTVSVDSVRYYHFKHDYGSVSYWISALPSLSRESGAQEPCFPVYSSRSENEFTLVFFDKDKNRVYPGYILLTIFGIPK